VGSSSRSTQLDLADRAARETTQTRAGVKIAEGGPFSVAKTATGDEIIISSPGFTTVWTPAEGEASVSAWYATATKAVDVVTNPVQVLPKG
jgi:hypothetical protein